MCLSKSLLKPIFGFLTCTDPVSRDSYLCFVYVSEITVYYTSTTFKKNFIAYYKHVVTFIFRYLVEEIKKREEFKLLMEVSDCGVVFIILSVNNDKGDKFQFIIFHWLLCCQPRNKSLA